MVLATVPAAPPTEKNHRATSWPAPISANVPYVFASRLSASAFCRVPVAFSMVAYLQEGLAQTLLPLFAFWFCAVQRFWYKSRSCPRITAKLPLTARSLERQGFDLRSGPARAFAARPGDG